MRPLVILLLLAACGGHGNDASDAPVAADAAAADAAAPDASGPDAATGPAVSITIQRNTVPVSGVHVIFTDATSSIVADVFTDTTGTASHVMAAGGSVTAIDPFPLIAQVIGASNLYTIAGVKPGDHLRLTQHASAPDGISFALLTAGIANATYYDFNTDCVEGAFGVTATGTAYFRKPCTSSDLYIVAFDAGSNVVGTLFHPDLAATQGATINLTGEPYLPAVTRSYTYANLPSSSVSTSYHLFSAKNVLSNGFVTGPAAGGTATLSLAQPAIDGHLAVVDSTMSVGTTFNDVIDWGTDGGDYTLDPTGLLLPTFSTPPAFESILRHAELDARRHRRDARSGDRDARRRQGRLPPVAARRAVRRWRGRVSADRRLPAGRRRHDRHHRADREGARWLRRGPPDRVRPSAPRRQLVRRRGRERARRRRDDQRPRDVTTALRAMMRDVRAIP